MPVAMAMIAGVCLAVPALASGTKVAVALPTMAFWTQQLLAPEAHVATLVPPGGVPEHADPAPSQVAALMRSELYLSMGLLAERDVVKALSRRGVSVAAIWRPEAAEADQLHPWLSPKRLQAMLPRMRAALEALDPAQAVEVQRRAGLLEARLAMLDETVAADLAPVKNQTVWLYHPAWAALLEDYGLKWIAVEQDGKERGVVAMERMYRRVRSAGIRTLVVPSQVDPSRPRQLAKRLDAEVVFLNPLASDGEAAIREAVSVFVQTAR